MSRSKWKGFFIESTLLKQSRPFLKIRSRSSAISEAFIGKTVFVYNGKIFKSLKVTREKIGFKFGEFAFTRKMQEKVKKKKIIKKKR